MTHDEMLKGLNLKHDELVDLLTKFESFHSSLNPQQQQVINSSLPSAVDAAKSFSPNVTPQNLQQLLSDSSTSGTARMAYAQETPAT